MKYENFNIEPGMASWVDMPKDYKRAYFGCKGILKEMKKPYKIRIIIAAYIGTFIELAESIAYSLKEMGVCENVIIQNEHEIAFNDHYDINFIIHANLPFSIEKINGYKILFQTEELWNKRERGFYDMCQGYDRALEMYDGNVKIPKGTERVVYCPVGYSPVWESHLPDVEEDIDVLFYGSITERRLTFQKELDNAGFKTFFTQKHYGLERDKLIMRSKIVLNIKAHNKWSYGPMHCLPAQANKRFMLVEKANGGYGPFKPGVHFAEYDGITHCIDAVRNWLDHDKERKNFAVNAYNDMVKTCDFTEILKKALDDLI